MSFMSVDVQRTPIGFFWSEGVRRQGVNVRSVVRKGLNKALSVPPYSF